MRTIAVINQKGGVGKTTTVANLGAGLAERGRRVCLMDLDPQSHLTLHFGIEPGSTPASSYDLLTTDTPLAEAALSVTDGLDVVPAVIDLAAAEVELVSTVGREQILRDRFAEATGDWELLLIDCPPSLGLLTLNALAAADDVIIPLQPHFLALQGLGKLLETVSLVQRRINPDLRVAGVILCLYETSTRLAAEVVEDLRGFFEAARGQQVPWADAVIFDSFIRRNVKLAECPSHGTTIFHYDPGSIGATDYTALADEFARRFPASQPTRGNSDTTPPPSPGEATSQASDEPAPTANSDRAGDETSSLDNNTPRPDDAPGGDSEDSSPPSPSAGPGAPPLPPYQPALPARQVHYLTAPPVEPGQDRDGDRGPAS